MFEIKFIKLIYKIFRIFVIFCSIVINIIVMVPPFDRSFLKTLKFRKYCTIGKILGIAYINVCIHYSRGFIIESLCYEIVRFAEFPPARAQVIVIIRYFHTVRRTVRTWIDRNNREQQVSAVGRLFRGAITNTINGSGFFILQEET